MFRFPVLIFCILMSRASVAQSLSIASDLWCPYICDDSEHPGYVVELAEQVFAELDIAAEMQVIPLKRSLFLTQKDDIQVTLALTTEHILEYQLLRNERPVGYFANDFYTRDDFNWQFSNIDELKVQLGEGHTLGIITGYAYGPEIESLAVSHPRNVYQASGADPLEQLLVMLATKRIDIVLDSRATVEYKAAINQLATLRYAGTDGEPLPLYLGFSPTTDPNLIRQFDRVLQNFEQDGRLSQILNRYQVNSWP